MLSLVLDKTILIMAFSFSSTSTAITCSKLYDNSGLQFTSLSSHKRNPSPVSVKCESTESELPANAKKSKLEVGSPVIVVEAPRMIKTAASVPCLRVNSGLVKPGDVGRYQVNLHFCISYR